MEETLRYILSNVNDWLKFAEAKNGALLVANIAILLGILGLMNDWTGCMIWMYLIILFLLIASSISALVSFVPQLRIPLLKPKEREQKEASLLFYVHVAEYDPEKYIKALYSESGRGAKAVTPIEIDYGRQIIANSQIALRKYRCFNIGLWLTVSALLFLLVARLITLLTR